MKQILNNPYICAVPNSNHESGGGNITSNENGMHAEEKLKRIREWLSAMFVERREVIDGMLTALLSRQHVLLIGMPGTAKSLMARAVCACISNAAYFERLLTKFSIPEEIFGAVKISALKEDRFEREIAGHLPTAHIAFIDEIFNANSSILNSLLSLINERIFYNNGSAIQCPLITLIGASNNVVDDEGLAALFDRFILRYVVNYIQEDSNFVQMLTRQDTIEHARNPPVQLTFEELIYLQAEAAKVTIEEHNLEMLVRIRNRLRDAGIVVSDRRYFQSLSVLKAYAYLNGHSALGDEDYLMLQYVLWTEPTQINKVRNLIIGLTNPYMQEAEEIYEAMLSACRELEHGEEVHKAPLAAETVTKLNQGMKKLSVIEEKLRAERRDTTRVKGYIADTQKKLKEILSLYLGITA